MGCHLMQHQMSYQMNSCQPSNTIDTWNVIGMNENFSDQNMMYVCIITNSSIHGTFRNSWQVQRQVKGARQVQVWRTSSAMQDELRSARKFQECTASSRRYKKLGMRNKFISGLFMILRSDSEHSLTMVNK